MSFKDTAKKQAERKYFALTEGKEQKDTKAIIVDYPNGVTITGFTVMLNKQKKEVSAFTFAEEPTKFFFGGVVLTDLAKTWCEGYNDDYEKASEALKNEGGVKLRLYRKTTKNGNECTAFEVL